MSKADATDIVSTGLSALAIFAQVLLALLAVLALLALVFPPARRVLVDLRDALGGKEIWLAWIVALAAVGGSLFFSEISGFVPCRLCWFQRIAMYPMVVILLVGALRKDVREVFQYAIVFPILGAAVSIYHLYIEAHPEAETQGCARSAPGGCATKWFEKFGYLTIPGLALTAFLSILALLLLAWSRRERPAAQAADASGAEPAPEAA